jgi:hypothetical protein
LTRCGVPDTVRGQQRLTVNSFIADAGDDVGPLFER